jgi:hypothetical protein
MSLSDLFSVNTSVRLTSDSNSWGDQIVNHLISKFPTLSKLVGDVTFAKVDPIKGNAVGYISMIGKPQRIPFIIDEYELNPLDIYIDNGKYLPLTENSINLIEKRTWPFKLVSQSERGQLLKTASLFEDTGDIKINFIEKHKDTLQKIAEEYPEIIEEFCNRNIPSNDEEYVARVFIKEASSNKPIVVRDIKNPDVEYKLSEFAKKFGKEVVTKLMYDKDMIISSMPPKVVLEIDKKELKNNFKQTKNRIGFVDINGEYVKARSFNHFRLSSLTEKNNSTDSNIIITECGKYLPRYMGSLVARENQDGGMEIHTEQAKAGDYAGIVIGDNFYGPFYINSISNMGGDKIYSVLTDSLDNINLRTSSDIKTIIPLDPKNYLISSFANLVKVYPDDMHADWIRTPEDVIKNAGLTVKITKQLNNKFTINDAGISGIDSTKLKDLGKNDAIVVLVRCGLSHDDARYALMNAEKDGVYTFQGNAKESKEEVKDEKLTKMASVINKITEDSDLLKVALASGDKSNIDLALGLNLVTYNNIKRFKLLIPDLYEMLDRLCKLLIIKRMNRTLFNIDETQLTQAIFALDNISYNLGSL